jgi:hypothetical protein
MTTPTIAPAPLATTRRMLAKQPRAIAAPAVTAMSMAEPTAQDIAVMHWRMARSHDALDRVGVPRFYLDGSEWTLNERVNYLAVMYESRGERLAIRAEVAVAQ